MWLNTLAKLSIYYKHQQEWTSESKSGTRNKAPRSMHTMWFHFYVTQKYERKTLFKSAYLRNKTADKATKTINANFSIMATCAGNWVRRQNPGSSANLLTWGVRTYMSILLHSMHVMYTAHTVVHAWEVTGKIWDITSYCLVRLCTSFQSLTLEENMFLSSINTRLKWIISWLQKHVRS